MFPLPLRLMFTVSGNPYSNENKMIEIIQIMPISLTFPENNLIILTY
jgi:hypothetical protein